MLGYWTEMHIVLTSRGLLIGTFFLLFFLSTDDKKNLDVAAEGSLAPAQASPQPFLRFHFPINKVEALDDTQVPSLPSHPVIDCQPG